MDVTQILMRGTNGTTQPYGFICYNNTVHVGRNVATKYSGETNNMHSKM